jgi:hypothetical protein
VTTASARPDRLHDLAARLAAASRDADEAARTVPSGVARHLAAASADELAALGRDLHRVARAFESADRGAPLATAVDARLVARLLDRFPGLATGALAAAAAAERGGSIGRGLRTAGPVDALRRLEQAASGASPAFAAGLLDRLGASGIVRLLDRAGREVRALELDPAHLGELERVLARLVAVAADAPLDPRLISRLGRTQAGRRALRAVARHLPTGLPTAFVVDLAVPLLVTSDEREDAGRADDLSATVAILRLVAADRDAALALESRRPSGRSPLLALLERAPTDAVIATITPVLRRLLSPAAPPAVAHRIRDGLVEVTLTIDGRRRVSGAYSELLGEAVALHPGLLDRLGRSWERAHASNGTTALGLLTRRQRFFEAASRSDDAVVTMATVLAVRRARRVADLLRRHPPGRLPARDLAAALDQADLEVHDLAVGADAAGRRDRPAVDAGIAAVTWGVRKGAALAPGGWAARTALGTLINRAQHEARRRWAHPDDDREQAAHRVLAADEARLVAAAMWADRRWRRSLRGAPPLRTAGTAALRRWIRRQARPARAVLAPLLTPRVTRS